MGVQVVHGALNTFNKSKPVIQIEVLKKNPNDLVSMLGHLGYKFYSITGDLMCIPSHLMEVYKFL